MFYFVGILGLTITAFSFAAHALISQGTLTPRGRKLERLTEWALIIGGVLVMIEFYLLLIGA